MQVIDTSGSESTQEGDESNVTPKTDTKTGESVNEPGDDSNLDGRGTGGETPEGGGQEEGAAGEGEGVQEPVDKRETFETLNAKITELQTQLQQVMKPPERAQEPPPPPITEEQWAGAEEKWGIPRTAIQQFAGALTNLKQEMRSFIEEQLGDVKFERSINSLAKDPQYSDAVKYETDIKEYLKRVDPRFHSNVDVLKDATIWARGKNIGKTTDKIRNEKERNMRIAGPARPSSPTTGGKGGKGLPALTAIEKSAADATDMPYEEYARLKANRTKGGLTTIAS